MACLDPNVFLLFKQKTVFNSTEVGGNAKKKGPNRKQLFFFTYVNFSLDCCSSMLI